MRVYHIVILARYASVYRIRQGASEPGREADQSQPLNRNIPRRRTSCSPSIGIYPVVGPVAAPQSEYNPAVSLLAPRHERQHRGRGG
eukprot:5685297-Pyramimonas_sp.AAC.1